MVGGLNQTTPELLSHFLVSFINLKYFRWKQLDGTALRKKTRGSLHQWEMCSTLSPSLSLLLSCSHFNPLPFLFSPLPFQLKHAAAIRCWTGAVLLASIDLQHHGGLHSLRVPSQIPIGPCSKWWFTFFNCSHYCVLFLNLSLSLVCLQVTRKSTFKMELHGPIDWLIDSCIHKSLTASPRGWVGTDVWSDLILKVAFFFHL